MSTCELNVNLILQIWIQDLDATFNHLGYSQVAIFINFRELLLKTSRVKKSDIKRSEILELEKRVKKSIY